MLARVFAHANHRAPLVAAVVVVRRLVVFTGVSVAYDASTVARIAVNITAMSVHTSPVVIARVVAIARRSGVSASSLWRVSIVDAMSGKALASDSEDDDVAVPAKRVNDVDAADAPPAKKVRRARRRDARTTDRLTLFKSQTATKPTTSDAREGKKPAREDDDDDDDSDADSVDSECVDDLSGDEVDASNIIEGGRRARRGRPTTFTAEMYAKAGPAFGSDSDDE